MRLSEGSDGDTRHLYSNTNTHKYAHKHKQRAVSCQPFPTQSLQEAGRDKRQLLPISSIHIIYHQLFVFQYQLGKSEIPHRSIGVRGRYHNLGVHAVHYVCMCVSWESLNRTINKVLQMHTDIIYLYIVTTGASLKPQNMHTTAQISIAAAQTHNTT